jgi:hypothetical protein
MVSANEIKSVLEQLTTPDVEHRRALMRKVDSWGQGELPAGAAQLILHAAARQYPPVAAYPETPNESLVRALCSATTQVNPDDLAAIYPSFDPQCQAWALRLLATLKGRQASQTLGMLLERATSECAVPPASWPVLLPLERDPRDGDLLLKPLLGMCSTDAGRDLADSVLLAYAKAGQLDDETQHECVRTFGPVAENLLTRLARARQAAGPGVRWEEVYDRDVMKAGLLLDLLGRLDASAALGPIRSAASHIEPWIAMWGTVGLLRRGQDVPENLLEALAADNVCRNALAKQLEEIGLLERFPRRYWNQASLAEAEMVTWLMFPTELSRAPDEIREIDVVPIDTDDGLADLYVFTFKTDPPHWAAKNGWMVGIAGPYLTATQPTISGRGATFSNLKSLNSMTIEEHVRTLLDTVGSVGGAV